MSEHVTHGPHPHVHGPGCGHVAVQHDGHVDYLHDGHLHGVARFEIADAEHHHHHVVDEATGRVEAFSDDDLERAIHAVAERLGLRLTGHDVVLRGTRAVG
jgi:hypothetical protein